VTGWVQDAVRRGVVSSEAVESVISSPDLRDLTAAVQEGLSLAPVIGQAASVADDEPPDWEGFLRERAALAG
jgi:hypothetical protein